MLNGASIPVPSAVGGGDGLYGSENGQSLTLSPVVSFSHHHDVLGKRLILDSTDRENHFLSRFENATVHNVGRNEGNLGTVRAIDNSKPLRVNFLPFPSFCRFSPRNPVLVQHLARALVGQETSPFIVLSRSRPSQSVKYGVQSRVL